jgi:undecaprenyl-diphosphatase
MAWNTYLFLLLNGPKAPAPALMIGLRMLAACPAVIVPALLTWLWISRPGRRRRSGLLAVALGALAGQVMNMVLGMIWFEPRPFMIGIGHTYLEHAADNGFPSDHSTIMFALGFGLVLTGAARAAGLAVCALGFGVGWARVYLGVHFPLDVLTGIPAGAAAGAFARCVAPVVERYVIVQIQAVYIAVLVALRLPAALFPRSER